ncbi:hypothetical protein F3Y22_tig00110788pilonHSYRG00530 [Hibiscus syriacus]|uniref:WAT1-related protein n=1 Tax=Hibiscus syriacus TaxID=106335 RepID=A0A6A2ZS80_HIBSY|nr:hypothetical protein F3Y22_tig00110788pilonHSYRG00530 [Hibiscus syriacus]
MEVVPSLAMLVVECTNVLSNILFKAASSKGLSSNIGTFYYSINGPFSVTSILNSRTTVEFMEIDGLFAHSFSSGVHTWGVRLKGPFFVASFRPASIVIAAIMGAIFLGEALYLGR